MSEAANQYFEEQDRKEKHDRLSAAARNVRNDFHLKTILLQFEKTERRDMYERIRPHLLFVPLKFRELMKLSATMANGEARPN